MGGVCVCVFRSSPGVGNQRPAAGHAGAHRGSRGRGREGRVSQSAGVHRGMQVGVRGDHEERETAERGDVRHSGPAPAAPPLVINSRVRGSPHERQLKGY